MPKGSWRDSQNSMKRPALRNASASSGSLEPPGPRATVDGLEVHEWHSGGTHRIPLLACRPEPLMAYLKAVGILRLLGEQRESSARGWWSENAFHLLSTLDERRLVDFFLHHYRPTPLVAPWAGGSGFFNKDNKRAVDAIAASTESRMADYRHVIDRVRTIVAEEAITEKPSGDIKGRLLRRYRNELPASVIDWMDAALILQESAQAFAPVLGTGGNDGRLDFTQNFMGRLVKLGIVAGTPHEHSEKWLCNALFGIPTDRLERAAVGQFSPGRAGGANATQGLEGDASDNPWDFVLMLEGALVLAGAVVRRLPVGETSRASFPFTVRAVPAGYDSAAEGDGAASRGELWLPIWDRPSTLAEVRLLFSEGRAELSGRTARNGLDFARAVATLGVDRGIRGFSRYAFLKRSGKTYLASPLGRFEVRERGEVDLLREIDPWLDRFRRATGDNNAPPRFKGALRGIEQAIFDLCRYGGKTYLQSLLIALGRAEGELAVTAGMIGQSKIAIRPLAGLSRAWITRSNDASTEFAIARALASVHDAEKKLGPLRCNLEPVNPVSFGADPQAMRWAERDRAVVWNSADLWSNLAAILARRVMDGARAGCERLPISATAFASLESVARFLAGETDDRRIADLVWGLVLVRGAAASAGNLLGANPPPLPRTYALLKLLYLPEPMRVGEAEIEIRPEPEILRLLSANRLDDACRIARRRLRASGLVPIPQARSMSDSRDGGRDHANPARIDGGRLAAALLMPIVPSAVSELRKLVLREPEPVGRRSEP